MSFFSSFRQANSSRKIGYILIGLTFLYVNLQVCGATFLKFLLQNSGKQHFKATVEDYATLLNVILGLNFIGMIFLPKLLNKYGPLVLQIFLSLLVIPPILFLNYITEGSILMWVIGGAFLLASRLSNITSTTLIHTHIGNKRRALLQSALAISAQLMSIVSLYLVVHYAHDACTYIIFGALCFVPALGYIVVQKSIGAFHPVQTKAASHAFNWQYFKTTLGCFYRLPIIYIMIFINIIDGFIFGYFVIFENKFLLHTLEIGHLEQVLLVGAGISCIFLSHMSDKIGVLKVYTVTLCITIISYALLAATPYLPLVFNYILYFFIGAGLSGKATLLVAYIGNTWPKDTLGTAFASKGLLTTIILFFSNALFGYLLSHYNNFVALGVIIFLNCIAIICFYIFLKRRSHRQEKLYRNS